MSTQQWAAPSLVRGTQARPTLAFGQEASKSETPARNQCCDGLQTETIIFTSHMTAVRRTAASLPSFNAGGIAGRGLASCLTSLEPRRPWTTGAAHHFPRADPSRKPMSEGGPRPAFQWPRN